MHVSMYLCAMQVVKGGVSVVGSGVNFVGSGLSAAFDGVHKVKDTVAASVGNKIRGSASTSPKGMIKKAFCVNNKSERFSFAGLSQTLSLVFSSFFIFCFSFQFYSTLPW